jgi:hypothetical protein
LCAADGCFAGKEAFKPTLTTIVLAALIIALIAGFALLSKRLEQLSNDLQRAKEKKKDKDD